MSGKDKIKVRVKLCGNCNPQYDVNKLLKKLQHSCYNLEYVYSDEDGYDIYMIINSCQVSCVSKPEVNCPIILVSGYSVNRKNVREDLLVDYLVQNLKIET